VLLESITIIEGSRFAELREALERHPEVEQTLRGLSDEQVMWRVSGRPIHPEGRFFPDTYRFAAGSTDVEIPHQHSQFARSARVLRARCALSCTLVYTTRIYLISFCLCWLFIILPVIYIAFYRSNSLVADDQGEIQCQIRSPHTVTSAFQVCASPAHTLWGSITSYPTTEALLYSFSRRARALLTATSTNVRFLPVFAHFCPFWPPACIISALPRLAPLKRASYYRVWPFSCTFCPIVPFSAHFGHCFPVFSTHFRPFSQQNQCILTSVHDLKVPRTHYINI
jgi:hypothetical protein